MDRFETFEQEYPKHPFAELVRLAIGLGKGIAQWRAQGAAGALSMGEIYDLRLGDRAA